MSNPPAQSAGMNAQRYFMRKEDYAPKQTPRESPFRQFEVKCLRCGSYRLRLMSQVDEEAGEMAVVVVCQQCPQREVVPVR